MSRYALLAALALCGGCVAHSAPSDPRHDVRQDLERHELVQRVARNEEQTEKLRVGADAIFQDLRQRTTQLEQALRKLIEDQRQGVMARGRAQAGPAQAGPR